ncbi:alpha/beta-hydrolase [Rozella allomycis CSF55]|uniref:Alpha/beta-hydrolase n=1 Tax=Rozella allomycis (strain CSF55) TaxID=988480 RepID=A0A075AT20_ROZAC|nr:Palmitoyl protein thioesterase domain-containing protein [Rozella allomycis CSF55]RKP20890.1 alpha/beta-hydrolase [Rozella allomycis CSF55]|eukprot:EPZ31875.1 Palmitoyl protein thioesterase domain-containing protein [Rozella allomycis CSF55]
MRKFANFLKMEVNGVVVRSIRIGENSYDDYRHSYFDNLNRQVFNFNIIYKVDEICAQLKMDQNLKDGFHAIGFSQGGQIMRAYVQRCNSPKVTNLITFGAQHQGINTAPYCFNDTSGLCPIVSRAISSSVYVPWVRENIVQAQYFKDLKNLTPYLKYNKFLADINNDHDAKTVFDDQVVVPRESGHFGILGKEGVVDIQNQTAFVEDWIGLRSLYNRNSLVFFEMPGGHVRYFKIRFQMQIDYAWVRKNIIKYLK